MLDVSYYDYKILLLFWILAGAAAVVGTRRPETAALVVVKGRLASRAEAH
jgi:hypothetical protein